jgi:hypothetical protein
VPARPVAPRPLRWGAAAALAALALAVPSAAGKGLSLSLTAGDARPAVGERVRISLTATPDETVAGPCRGMRIVVVAPGVPVRRALRFLEGGREPRRIGRWGAFRLASLRATGDWSWAGRLRPNRPGPWTLVVPNWCAAGYVLPEGVARLVLDVRARERGSARTRSRSRRWRAGPRRAGRRGSMPPGARSRP